MRRMTFTLLLLCSLAACSPPSEQVVPTQTATAAATATTQPSPTPTESPTTTPAPTATPLTCWEEGGVLVTEEVPSQLLPESIPMLVYLPPCFFARPGALYPTLYLIHGQGFNQNQWVRLGIVELADSLIASGEAAPFLIVMPYVADWSQPTETPFGRALVDEVLPYIEAGYQANPIRAARAVGGLSRGGSWSLHAGVRFWEKFSAVGAHSGPVFIDDGDLFFGWLKTIPPGLAPRIYLDIASSERSDIRRSVLWMTQKFDQLGIEYQFTEFDGGHTEEFWRRHIEEYLNFYAAGWKP
jgi:enterochelin esterase-like enzyme